MEYRTKTHRRFRAVFGILPDLALLAAVAGCSTGPPHRTCVFDRNVEVQEDVVWQVPEVSPWCDSIGFEIDDVDIGGCRLHVEEEGAGIPLVLLHGGPGSTHHEFHPYFSRAAAFARVIYYDQRGCGSSDYAEGDGYSVEQAVGDLESLRRALGIEEWIVLGHSYGGFLAQCYTIEHPERVRGLVLVTAACGLHDRRLNESRESHYLNSIEKERMAEFRKRINERAKEEGWQAARRSSVLVFNNYLNGDWKRQSFYKPSIDEVARIARYGWRHDFERHFNSQMSSSMRRQDLEGAFTACPIPTLILESENDLTWCADKPRILHENHPTARMELFKRSGHDPYADEPERFFELLEEFVTNTKGVEDSAVDTYRAEVAAWKREQERSLAHMLRHCDLGADSLAKVAAAYERGQMEALDDSWLLFVTGLALYEAGDYEEALRIFARMDRMEPGGDVWGAIWEGHMLDLLHRREEALAAYRRVVAMEVDSVFTMDQYGLEFRPREYAMERIETPFVRIENTRR